jgi:Fe-S cluster biogenesis protein NfuA
MFIQTIQTPNPRTLKFAPGQEVMSDGTIFFTRKEVAQNCPLALALFDITGVTAVFLGSDFITVTKADAVPWEHIKAHILSAITQHFSSGLPMIDPGAQKNNGNQDRQPAQTSLFAVGDMLDDYLCDDDDVVSQIRSLIETKVRPAVAQDGGDIVFQSFDDGIVRVSLRGACSGCPSSTATLKSGIENMLRHYVPEVDSVEAT